MSDIEIVLSRPEDLNQFREEIHTRLNAPGPRPPDLRAQLERRGDELDLHSLDIEQVLAEFADALAPIIPAAGWRPASKPEPGTPGTRPAQRTAQRASERAPLARLVEQKLRAEATLLPTTPYLAPLRAEFERCYTRLHEPIRVAIVGLIKAGKSTLMNALLGEMIAPTGAVEATFNVNWFRYSEQRELRVHYKDGRPPETRPFADLEQLTRRTDEQLEAQLEIACIEVRMPAEVLQILDLVDTPGLASVYVDDSENTRRFLQLHGQALTEATRTEAATADATLYLFSQGVSDTDIATVEAFLGDMGGSMTPLNSLGVLTKADIYWSPPDDAASSAQETPTPIDTGRRITQRLMNTPRLRRAFYALYPVCGLLAQGVATLTEAEFATLERLGAACRESAIQAKLIALLGSERRFATREDAQIPATPTERQALLARLGRYGVWMACERLQQGDMTRAELTAWLSEHSGLEEIRSRIITHFGNRAALVKIASVVAQLRSCWKTLRVGASPQEQQAGAHLLGTLERMELEIHAFQELKILRDYYDGRLNLTDREARQLLTVTGENGISCAARLDAAPDTLPLELMRLADERIRAWALRSTDTLMLNSATVSAVQVVQRSYERVRHRLAQARSALDATAAPLPDEGERNRIARYLQAGVLELAGVALREVEAAVAPNLTLCARLGAPEATVLEDLLPLAAGRKEWWYLRANDRYAFNAQTCATATAIAHNYERIEGGLRRAQDLLVGDPF